jgi:hypothetical protein
MSQYCFCCLRYGPEHLSTWSLDSTLNLVAQTSIDSIDWLGKLSCQASELNGPLLLPPVYPLQEHEQGRSQFGQSASSSCHQASMTCRHRGHMQPKVHDGVECFLFALCIINSHLTQSLTRLRNCLVSVAICTCPESPTRNPAPDLFQRPRDLDLDAVDHQ